MIGPEEPAEEATRDLDEGEDLEMDEEIIEEQNPPQGG